MSIIVGKDKPVKVSTDEVSQWGIMTRFRLDKTKAEEEARKNELRQKAEATKNVAKPAPVTDKTEKKDVKSTVLAASEPVKVKSPTKGDKTQQTSSDGVKTAPKGTSYIIDGSQIMQPTMKKGGRGRKSAKTEGK